MNAPTQADIFIPGAMLAALLVMSGCQAPTEESSALSGSTESNVEVATYRYFKTSTVYGTQVVLAGHRERLGDLSLNFEKNELSWNGKPLIFTRADDSFYRFIEPASKTQLIVGHVPVDGSATISSSYSPTISLSSVVSQGELPSKQTSEFLSSLNRIRLPKDQIGLVVLHKYIDGNQVDVSGSHYAGSLQVTDMDCRLDGTPAIVRRLPLQDGSSIIVVSTAKDELLIWPHGLWLRYNTVDRGLAVAGSDNSLQQLYLQLRQRALQELNGSHPNDWLKRIPKQLNDRKADQQGQAL